MGVLLAAFLMAHCSLLISSCSSIDCSAINYVGTYFSMLKPDGTKDTLYTDTLWVWTTRVDQKDTLLNRLSGAKDPSFVLQTGYTQPEDMYYTLLVDTLGNEWLDTICIQKENYPHFESVDCKASYFHKITGASVTHHAFDSIVINYPTVNYETTHTHIYLYRKTDR